MSVPMITSIGASVFRSGQKRAGFVAATNPQASLKLFLSDAQQVVKLFGGAKVADIPVEQPTSSSW
jgi:hypothetical protein